MNRLKSEFVSSVSHELRTPLTTIKTLTHVLLRGQPGEEERREYLKTIAAECERQIDPIDYLLSEDVERQLARSEAVRVPLHAGVEGPKNIPSIDTFTPMTLDYAKAASRVEEVTSRLATILGL